MQTAIEHEYKVLMTHFPVAKSNGSQRWRATLLDIPNIVEEAFTRDQAIRQIRERIAEMLSHAEIVTLHVPAVPMDTNEVDDELTLQGWGDHGLFKGDEAALSIFDQIERERDQALVGES